MVILVDTNVALDFLTMRQPYYADSKAVFELCAKEKLQGYISFHSLPNIFYILRKIYSDKDRRILLKKLCDVLQVVGASHEKVLDAIENDEFADFEDCLQDECALECSAQYIITRNIADYTKAKVKSVTPTEFLTMLEPEPDK